LRSFHIIFKPLLNLLWILLGYVFVQKYFEQAGLNSWPSAESRLFFKVESGMRLSSRIAARLLCFISKIFGTTATKAQHHQYVDVAVSSD
jgi:hypothetical protein